MVSLLSNFILSYFLLCFFSGCYFISQVMKTCTEILFGFDHAHFKNRVCVSVMALQRFLISRHGIRKFLKRAIIHLAICVAVIIASTIKLGHPPIHHPRHLVLISHGNLEQVANDLDPSKTLQVRGQTAPLSDVLISIDGRGGWQTGMWSFHRIFVL